MREEFLCGLILETRGLRTEISSQKSEVNRVNKF